MPTKILLVSIVTNVVLTVLKIAGGLLAGSTGLVADGFHSLDQVYGEGEKSLEEQRTLATEHRVPSPEERFELAEQKEMLAEEIKRLPGQERTVISLYYFEYLLLREIGEVMELSDSRICQLHHSALARLRSAMSQKLLDTASVG